MQGNSVSDGYQTDKLRATVLIFPSEDLHILYILFKAFRRRCYKVIELIECSKDYFNRLFYGQLSLSEG